MPYCTQCGRYLFDGETCSCSSSDKSGLNAAPPPQNNYQSGMQQTPPPQYGYQQQYTVPPNGYAQQPYPYNYGVGNPYAQPEKKSGAGIVLLVLGIFFLLIVIGAAILVPSMVGFVEKSKESSIKSTAHTFSKAATTTLIEMDEEGENIKGVYIISSNPEDNVAVPFDVDRFYKGMKNYVFDSEKYEYFLVIRNGNTEYAAVSENWTKKTDMIGTWPAGTKPRYYEKDSSTGKEVKKKVNLDDLYWHAYDELFS